MDAERAIAICEKALDRVEEGRQTNCTKIWALVTLGFIFSFASGGILSQHIYVHGIIAGEQIELAAIMKAREDHLAAQEHKNCILKTKI